MTDKTEAADMVERFRQALCKIAEGLVPPDRHGHYLAHREAVRVARAALRPASTRT